MEIEIKIPIIIRIGDDDFGIVPVVADYIFRGEILTDIEGWTKLEPLQNLFI